MNAVADMFDHGDHLIDYMEFIAALRPDWLDKKPVSEGDVIDDEVQRQVMKCTCRQKFRVFQVGEGKYRVSIAATVNEKHLNAQTINDFLCLIFF